MIPEGFEKVDRCVCLLHLASKKCWQSDRPFLLFLCITLVKLGSPRGCLGTRFPLLALEEIRLAILLPTHHVFSGEKSILR